MSELISPAPRAILAIAAVTLMLVAIVLALPEGDSPPRPLAPAGGYWPLAPSRPPLAELPREVARPARISVGRGGEALPLGTGERIAQEIALVGASSDAVLPLILFEVPLPPATLEPRAIALDDRPISPLPPANTNHALARSSYEEDHVQQPNRERSELEVDWSKETARKPVPSDRRKSPR